jgi:serine/threonine protein kinase
MKENKENNVMREKNLLLKLKEHPFIIKLKYTFMDQESLYFVFEHCKHGTLTALIQREKQLKDDLCTVYAAEIVSSLEFMHNNKILHRDLKPENIMVGEDLHLRLIDFGDAKEFEDSIYDETRTYLETKVKEGN